MSLPQDFIPEGICRQRVSTVQKVKVFSKPCFTAQVSYEPFDRCLSRAKFSHLEYPLSSLNRQKLLSQNQVPQREISLLKNTNKLPFHFHFSDVYTPNHSYFESTRVLYLLRWISCENSIFLSFVESGLPHFMKIFAITKEGLASGCWMIKKPTLVALMKRVQTEFEKGLCVFNEHLLVVILIKLPYLLFSSAAQKREQQFPEGR